MVIIDGFIGNYGYGIMEYGGIFFGLLFWTLIIVVAYLLNKWLVEQIKIQDSERRFALGIAKVRCAKGEITEEEILIGMLT